MKVVLVCDRVRITQGEFAGMSGEVVERSVDPPGYRIRLDERFLFRSNYAQTVPAEWVELETD